MCWGVVDPGSHRDRIGSKPASASAIVGTLLGRPHACTERIHYQALSEATPLTLHLSVDGDAPMLVIAAENGPLAIFLSGNYAFHVMSCAGRDDWYGMQLHGVQLEIDEASLRPHRGPPGALGRMGSKLVMKTLLEKPRQMRTTTILDSLDEASTEVHFLKWQITLGNGPDKRVLQTVEVLEQS